MGRAPCAARAMLALVCIAHCVALPAAAQVNTRPRGSGVHQARQSRHSLGDGATGGTASQRHRVGAAASGSPQRGRSSQARRRNVRRPTSLDHGFVDSAWSEQSQIFRASWDSSERRLSPWPMRTPHRPNRVFPHYLAAVRRGRRSIQRAAAARVARRGLQRRCDHGALVLGSPPAARMSQPTARAFRQTAERCQRTSSAP